MTKEESLYQVKLILENLNQEDYKKIPEETWDYINENMEYNENIVVNPEIPLEEQDIDDKTYEFIEKLIYKIEHNSKNEKNQESKTKEDSLYDMSKDELITLLNQYKEENSKIVKVKELVNDYKNTLENNVKEIEILKQTNRELYEKIDRCPKLIKKIFFKDFEQKLLK